MTMEKKIRKNFELTKLSNGLVRVKMWSIDGDCYCNQLTHQVLSIGDIYTKTGILMPKTDKFIKWN